MPQESERESCWFSRFYFLTPRLSFQSSAEQSPISVDASPFSATEKSPTPDEKTPDSTQVPSSSAFRSLCLIIYEDSYSCLEKYGKISKSCYKCKTCNFWLTYAKALNVLFFSSVFLILSNFILLIHFPTHWSFDSQDLLNSNSWESQSSKSSAKILQNIFKSCKILQKFCRCYNIFT